MWGFILICVHSNRLQNLPINSVWPNEQRTSKRSEQHLNDYCSNIVMGLIVSSIF